MNKKESALTKKLIYVGPNLSRGRLLRYSIYIGGYPTHLESEFEKCPNLKKLFVPITNLQDAENAIQKTGTPLNKYYGEVMAAFKEV